MIRANSTPHEHVKRAADIIGRERIIGVVLNQAEASPQPAYGTTTTATTCATRKPGSVMTRVRALHVSIRALIADRVRDRAHRGARSPLPPTSALGERASCSWCRRRRHREGLLIAVVAQGAMYYADLYDLRLLTDRRELFTRMLHALASASLILAALYFWFPALIIGRGVFIVAACWSSRWSSAGGSRSSGLSRRLRPRERLLLVGTSAAAVDLARELFERRHELGVEIVGFIDPDPAQRRQPGPQSRRGRHDRGYSRRSFAPAASIASSSACPTRAASCRWRSCSSCKLDGVNFDHLASVYEEYTGKIAVENLRPSWLIFSAGFRKTRVLTAAKRALDVTAAGVGLVLALPLMALVAIAVKLTSPGQRAVPPAARRACTAAIFTVHKFRSMREDAEAATGPVWASKQGDSRVTPSGGWLRRHASRRAAAALERAAWRHELCRAAARTSGVRQRPHPARSRLWPAACRAARHHRLGAGPIYLRRHRRGRAAEAAVRPLLHQAPVDRARYVHHLRHGQDRSAASGRVTWLLTALVEPTDRERDER